MITLIRNLRESRRYEKYCKKLLTSPDSSKHFADWHKYEHERSKSQCESNGYALSLVNMSLGRFKDVEFEDHPDYGDLMTLEEWVETCSCGSFIDYDGHGNLSTVDKCSNIEVYPSISKIVKYPEWATHVLWYNR